MRVAIVVRRLSPRGGMESNVLALAQHLVRRGHALTVVCQRVEQGVELDAERVEISAPGWLGESAKLLAFARSASETLTRLAPDVSMTSGHAYGVSVARLESGLVADYREARSERGGLIEKVRAFVDPVERAAERVERRKVSGARLVLVLSDAARASALRRHRLAPERVRVVRNGVDLSRFSVPSAADAAEARRALGVEGRALAFVGNGFGRKGLDLLLSALAHPAAPRDLTLLVAGHDRRSVAYEARARALGLRARFLGARSDVREVIAAADGLVLPTRYDPFGLVVLEALAMGRPVLVSRAAGASEIVPRSELILDDPSNTEAFAQGLQRLVAAMPGAEGPARRAAEAHPLEASYDAVEAALEEARAG